MTSKLRWLLTTLGILGSVFSAAHGFSEDYRACPADLGGYLRPLLAVGESGEIREDGVPTRARSAPTLNAEIAFQIEPGTSFTVIGGPACADGYLWWRVAYAEQLGWTAESSVSERIYYYQPASAPASSPRPAITRETLGRVALLPYDLPVARFDVAAFAPFTLLQAADSVRALVSSDEPTRILGRLEGDRRLVDAAFDPSGQYFALGVFDVELGSYSAGLHRYIAGAIPSMFPAAAPIVLDGEIPLVAVALQPPYLLTLHGDGEDALGALLTWRMDSGELLGRIELDMAPSYLVGDSTGSVVAMSAAGGANARTVLIDLRTQEIVAHTTEYGVLAWNPYPGSGREQVLIGQADGTVAFYLALPSEMAQPPDIVPARLERLGAVEVFVRWDDVSPLVQSLALDPGGQLLAVGGGVGESDAMPDDFGAAVAFVDLQTLIVSAESVRGDNWRSVDQLGFSSDGTALWVGYQTRDAGSLLGVYGVPAGG